LSDESFLHVERFQRALGQGPHGFLTQSRGTGGETNGARLSERHVCTWHYCIRRKKGYRVLGHPGGRLCYLQELDLTHETAVFHQTRVVLASARITQHAIARGIVQSRNGRPSDGCRLFGKCKPLAII
jgi:hypothetical protein